MGEDALDSQVVTVEDGKPDEGGEKSESAEVSEGEEDSSQDQETDRLEIVRRSGEGSQPNAKKQPGFLRRVSKLTKLAESAEGRTTEVSNELVMEQEKNKLLTLALEQSKSTKTSELPNPEDFDDGVSGKEYQQALQSHTDALIDSRVSEAMNKSAGNFTATHDKAAQDTELRHRQDKHYERAEGLGVKDYAEVENKAIDILGTDNVNHFIRASDNSELVLYYLGKNPGEAEEIAALIKTNPVKATLQLGALGNDLEIKPRGDFNPAPDPDEELEGGSPSASNSKMTKYERQLDKLRDEGDMSKIIAFKRKAKEDGVIS